MLDYTIKSNIADFLTVIVRNSPASFISSPKLELPGQKNNNQINIKLIFFPYQHKVDCFSILYLIINIR